MGLLSQRNPPNLPVVPAEYDPQFMNQLLNALRLFFNNINSVQTISVGGILLDLDALPTEAELATLRAGTVYRDTSAGNVLKVKV
jgi:hypothetical protein